MGNASLSETSTRRAFKDTISTQKTAKFMWGGEGVSAVAGGAWLTQIAPLDASTFEMVWRSIIGGLGGLATAILVIFLWNLYKAPYRQRNEARMALNKPNRAISDGLANLYRELIHLMAEKIDSAKNFKDWNERKDKWWEDALAYIDHNISYPEAILFSRASFTRKDNEKVIFEHQYNEAHCDALISLRVLSEKLEKLMTRYDKAIDSSG